MDFSTAWTVGSVLLGVIGTVITWAINNVIKAANDHRKLVSESIEQIKNSHNQLEIRVARDYISVETFRLFEQRIVDTINSLGDKIESFRSKGRR